MAITVQCPHCQGQFNVRDDFAGRKGRCPQCNGVVQAPEAAEAVEATVVESVGAPPPAPRRPARKFEDSPAAPVAAPAPATETGFPLSVDESSVAMRAGGGHRHSSTRGGGRNKGPMWPFVALGVAVPLVIVLIVTVIVLQNSGNQVAQGEGDASAQQSGTGAGSNQGGDELTSGSNFGEPRQANSLETINEAAVKILSRYPSVGAESFGTGFIIDRRGWIATNYHVIQDAHVDSVAVTYGGQELEIEGIIAVDPTHDLAILKLKEVPYTITVADISFAGEPDVLETVYAYGHPLGEDFSATAGAVGRVVTTSQLSRDSQSFLHHEMDAPSDMIWIQHDVLISPGNSGGPLLDQDYRIIGVNTWTNQATRFGYASHVKYLREMMFTASGEVTPLPSEREVVERLMREHGGGRPPALKN